MMLANPFAILYFGVGVMVLGALALGIVSRRRTPVFWEYSALVGAVAVHTIAYALDLASTSLEQKVFFHRIAWVGFSVAPPAALLLALGFVKKRPGWPLLIGLAAVVAALITLAWTNEHHHLLEGPAALVEEGGYLLRVQARGPLFWVYFLFASACALTALGIFGASWLSGPAVHRAHARTLFLALLAPWILNVVFASGVLIIRPTPFALGISSLVITWAFFRDGFLNLAPVAHEAVFATLREPIFVLDREGRLIDHNPAARALADGALSAGERAASRFPFLDLAAKSGEPEVIEVDGRRFELRWLPVGAEGRVVMLYDVTTREAEAEFSARALSARADFIARMSHELRTPLQGVLGSLDLLELQSLTAPQSAHVTTARRSAKVLLDLLDEILTFERTSAGITLERDAVSPASLVDEVTAAVSATAELKGLRLERSTSEAALEPLEGDRMKLRHILLNLAANAVKFTQTGAVRIGAETAGDGPLRELTLWVEDTGPGIPEAQLPRTLEPFVQLESTRTRRHGGVGLGLSICRKFADAMGGALELENRPEGGLVARFKCALPVAASSPEARASSLPPEVPLAAEVLLVEDHPVSRAVVSDMLEAIGARVTAVGDGASALARAAESRFDVALVDLHMPELDGIATTRGLRALPTPPHVVIFTSDERPSVNQECLEAGAAEVLRKPASSSALERSLRRALTRPEGGASRPRDRLIDAFLQTYPGEIAALRRAVADDDAGARETILHGMIGASALLGLTEVVERCRRASAAGTLESVAALEASCAQVAG